MAQTISLLGAIYSDVPAVLLPKQGSGTARFDDTTDADAAASDIASGRTAYVNGVKLTGTASGGITSTDALLIVQAPTGYTVTVSKGATSMTSTGHRNAADHSIYDHLFVIHQAQFDSTAWSISATDGTYTGSASVVINSADTFYVTSLAYTFYLIYNGLLTGQGITKYRTANTIVQNSGYVHLGGGNDEVNIFTSTNKVDLTRFSKLSFVVTGGYGYYRSGKTPIICIGSSRPTASSATSSSTITNITAYKMLRSSTGSFSGTFELDLSSYSGEYYIGFCVSGNNNEGYANVTKFGLE